MVQGKIIQTVLVQHSSVNYYSWMGLMKVMINLVQPQNRSQQPFCMFLIACIVRVGQYLVYEGLVHLCVLHRCIKSRE